MLLECSFFCEYYQIKIFCQKMTWFCFLTFYKISVIKNIYENIQKNR